ncbi:S-layer homology domain-containing protein [Bacillus sp. 37MA]|uniref:S-layer homology domain-containing protein n=1 Tax=Bacillus sp. 37MA TaxID=1132442 RepID=UPI00038157AA|nr:S-layer homology domain-containing protein [Bacillus sp. 37MA]
MRRVVKVALSFILLTSLLLPSIQAEAAGKFRDVASNHWAINQIEFLSSKGVISGFSDGTFKPETNVTRGQAAIMLVRALDLSLSNRSNPGFKDVSTKHSAYKYIAAIVDAGIYPKGAKYEPDKTLTREEMARMLVNAYSFKGQKNVTFSDVSKSYWAQPYISLLAENGITAGFSNGTFQPKGAVTRAQFSVFLSRCLDDRFKVEPVTGNNVPILMKDIKFGMTYQQVISRETREISYNFPTGVAYYAEKYGVNTYLDYFFENNQLDYIMYDFNPNDDYFSDDELWDIYIALQEVAASEFGGTYYYDEGNYGDYVSYSSLWFMNGYEVFLYVTNEDGINQITLSYQLPSYTGASEQDKKNRLNHLIQKAKQHSQQLNEH